MKYQDALLLDEGKAAYHFNVGRLQCVQGNYEDAIKRLDATLGWNNKLSMAK